MSDPLTRLVQREGRPPRRREPSPEKPFPYWSRAEFDGSDEEYERRLWQWMRAPAPPSDTEEP